MSTLDDLTTAVAAVQDEQAALKTQADAVVTTVADLVNEVANLNEGLSAGDQEKVDAAVASLNTITGNLTDTATELATAASSDPGTQPTPPVANAGTGSDVTPPVVPS